MPSRAFFLALTLAAGTCLNGCSAMPSGIGGGPAVMQRSQPAVAVDSAALANRVGTVTAAADRCGLIIDLERNKKMLRDFEKKVGRSDEAIAATLAGFEAAFARGLAGGCPGGSQARLAEELILIEDGQFNALMTR
ncbi:MAG: hypothetical protein JNM13_08105 [Hyphomicrobiaceae bacterium]|nr:hypothetical protein [Hyphomicrobiaceae bacterium]